MHSLNPRWTLADFHARIAALAGVKAGDRVLDLGCGSGHGLRPLLAASGSSGEIVGVDRDRRALASARATFAAEVANGRLRLVDAELSAQLPFADGGFDSIVCQNVIECLADRRGLLSEMHRVLKLGGSLLVGHHDFDGVMIASDDRDLTRRFIHGYADLTQPWQETSDGQMGRLLPGLLAETNFTDPRTETLLFVDLALTDDSYAHRHLSDMVALGPQFGIPANEAKRWMEDLSARSQKGSFYYALPWTYVLARRP